MPAADSGVRWLDATWGGVLVGGVTEDGGPLVAVVERDRAWPVAVDGHGGVWSMQGGERVVVYDEAAGHPVGTVLWHMPELDGELSDPEVLEPYAPTLPDGRAPDRLWLTEEDEGAAAVGGFLDRRAPRPGAAGLGDPGVR